MLAWWFVGLAVVGAFGRALGSALQERDAVSAPGAAVARFDLLAHLVCRPRWLAGIALAGFGVVLHLVALGGAPLALVQPVAVTALVFAVALAAGFNRRRVTPGELCAAAAVMGGLAAFVAVFPGEDVAPVLAVGAAAALPLGVAGLGGLALVLACRVGPGARALWLAATAGLALAMTSAFVRVIAVSVTSVPAAALAWFVLAAVGGVVLCGLLLQNAFRTGRFAAAYSAFLLCDSASGVGIGVLLLGEPLPAGAFAQGVAAGAAALAVAGTVALTMARRAPPGARVPTEYTHQPHTAPPEKEQDQCAQTYHRRCPPGRPRPRRLRPLGRPGRAYAWRSSPSLSSPRSTG